MSSVTESQMMRDEIIRFESSIRSARRHLLDVINTQTTDEVRRAIGSDTEEFDNICKALSSRLREIQSVLYGPAESSV